MAKETKPQYVIDQEAAVAGLQAEISRLEKQLQKAEFALADMRGESPVTNLKSPGKKRGPKKGAKITPIDRSGFITGASLADGITDAMTKKATP